MMKSSEAFNSVKSYGMKHITVFGWVIMLGDYGSDGYEAVNTDTTKTVYYYSKRNNHNIHVLTWFKL